MKQFPKMLKSQTGDILGQITAELETRCLRAVLKFVAQLIMVSEGRIRSAQQLGGSEA